MRLHKMPLALAGSLILSHAALALDPREVFKLAEPGSVVVLASNAKSGKNVQGSGVILAPLEVLTSCKIVESATDIVVSQGSSLRIARLRFTDSGRDLCQLHLDDPLPAGKAVVLSPASGNLEIGQDVYTVSSPRGLDRILGRSMISGLRETAGTSGRLIQIDAVQAAGSSGGGVFDQDGRLAGIITPQFRQSESESYAVPVEWIAELAKRNPDLMIAAASTGQVAPGKSADIAPQDERWRPAKGDRWRYQLVDGKKIVGKVNIEVLESSPGRVRERITKDGSPGFFSEREVRPEFSTQAFLPLVALPGGYQLIELAAYLPPDAEIQPGAFSSQIPGNVSMPQVGTRNVVWAVKLTGRERVRVPAGEFDAWRIDASSSVNMQYGDVRLRYSIWYSTASRRAVKIYLATLWPIAVQSSFETLELTSYDKAKE